MGMLASKQALSSAVAQSENNRATEIDADQIVRLRSAVMRLSRDLRKAAAREGLTDTQSSVLMTVVREESIPLSDLAEVEALNPTMLSRVIGYLEDAGYLKREKDQTDRRSISVHPTAQGRRLIQRMRDRRTQQLTERLESLTSDETKRLTSALSALEKLAGIPAKPI